MRSWQNRHDLISLLFEGRLCVWAPISCQTAADPEILLSNAHWSSLSHANLLKPVQAHHRAYIIACLAYVLASAGVIILFGLTAALCKAYDAGGYRKLTDAAKLILASHIVYSVVLMSTAAPYSVGLVKAMFAPDAPATLLQQSVQRCLFLPLGFQLALYVFEVSSGFMQANQQGEQCSTTSVTMQA